MKKTAAFFIVLMIFVTMSSVFAQDPVEKTGPSGAEKVGTVADMTGKVELKSSGQDWQLAEKGQPVFMGDEVRTGSEGQLGILLFDQTVFKIGPNSTITVDEFIFDAMKKDGRVKSNVAKGVLRYVSGKVTSKDPGSVTSKEESSS